MQKRFMERTASLRSLQRGAREERAVPSAEPSSLSSPGSTFSQDSNTVTTSTRRRRVHHHVGFGAVEIREYNRIVGDNPSVSSGPPLSIDWTYNIETVQTYTINDYERMQQPIRRSEKDLIVPRLAREELLLLEWNEPPDRLARAVAAIVVCKRQRLVTAQTVLSRRWSRVDAVWQTAVSNVWRHGDVAWDQTTREAHALHQQHLAATVQSMQSSPVESSLHGRSKRVGDENASLPSSTADDSCDSPNDFAAPTATRSSGTGRPLNPMDKDFDYAQYYYPLYQPDRVGTSPKNRE